MLAFVYICRAVNKYPGIGRKSFTALCLSPRAIQKTNDQLLTYFAGQIRPHYTLTQEVNSRVNNVSYRTGRSYAPHKLVSGQKWTATGGRDH